MSRDGRILFIPKRGKERDIIVMRLDIATGTIKPVPLETTMFGMSYSRTYPSYQLAVNGDGTRIVYYHKESDKKERDIVIADGETGKTLKTIRVPVEMKDDPEPRYTPLEKYGEDFKGMDIKVTVAPEELEKDPKKKEEKK